MIAGLEAGDEDAATAFYERYGPVLERFAANHLATVMLRRIGPDEVAHSVCRTFFRRVQGERLQIDGKDRVWNLLCAITLAKARKGARFHGAQKRGVDREQTATDGHDPTSDAPTRDASPEEAAAFAEQLQQFLDTLTDEERRIVLLRLEQRTQDEIAAELGCSERTVRRLMNRVEERLVASWGCD